MVIWVMGVSSCMVCFDWWGVLCCVLCCVSELGGLILLFGVVIFLVLVFVSYY